MKAIRTVLACAFALGCGGATPGAYDFGQAPEFSKTEARDAADPGPEAETPGDDLAPADEGADADDPGPVDVVEAGDLPGADLPDAADVPADTAGGPVVTVFPALIDFSFVGSGETPEYPVSVRNAGTAPLEVRSLTLKGPSTLSLLFGPEGKKSGDHVEYVLAPPAVVAPGASLDGKIRFAPIDATPLSAELRVFTDDPAQAAGFLVHVLGNQKVPCLDFQPPQVAFPILVVGTPAEAKVSVRSCGQTSVTVTGVAPDAAGTAQGISLGFEAFPGGVAPTPSAPLVMAPGEKRDLAVRIVPVSATPPAGDGQPAPVTYAVVFQANTFDGSSVLPVVAAVTGQACTSPVIDVAEGLAVGSGTLLHLSGVKSSSSFGKVVAWSWTATQPDANGADLVPSASVPDPVFLVGAPGHYEFRLDATDDQGNPSCAPAVVKVEASYRAVGAIQLTWPAGTTGHDLDLHLLHPNAVGVDLDGDGTPDGWFDPDWDCSWNNPEPGWPGAHPPAALVATSDDGSGPEVVLMGLDCAGTYRFGVNDFDDLGGGTVEATLKAWDGAKLAWAQTVALAPGDLWDAGTLSCNPTAIAGVPGPHVIPAW